MSYTLYDATIVMVQHCVESVKCILQKGEAAPNAASLLEARIHEDMLPLSFQVHMVTSLSEKVLANLLGREPMKLENNFKTFDDMYKRIAVVSEVLAKADRDTINGRDGQTVKFDMGPKAVEISTLGYVNGVVLPNILFHLTTAYDILRKEGVPLGKMDYLRPFFGKYVDMAALGF
ncbi:hypothetical protein CDD83_130 [Cordyceps sp. RAO-2017]|nr:hypothetical protein CDD83_130 [Cordyceps sp. RAO-2017]